MERQDAPQWRELEDRLQKAEGGIIIAQDSFELDTQYRIMQRAQPSGRPSVSNETGGMVSVSETGGATAYKDGKEISDLVYMRRIGKGGFGVAYKFKMTNSTEQIDKIICLKQAKYQTSDELFRENEIFLHIAKERHQYIIWREFMCSTSTDHFLGLEYFDGMNLNVMISLVKKTGKPTDSNDLLMILTQQTKAVHYLQKCGVCHGDIKPENVLYNPKSGKSKLIDFGLASGMNANDKTGGTTVYMAPEALMELERHFGTDIFSLGATLHSVMTLERPWHTLGSIREIKSAQNMNKEEKRRAIRQAIKNEISMFRESRKVTGKFHHMSIQSELLNTITSDSTIKKIVFQMLHHDPMDRPTCTDILAEFVSSTDSPEAEPMWMSSRSSSNNLSDLYPDIDMMSIIQSDGDSLNIPLEHLFADMKNDSGTPRGHPTVEMLSAGKTSADLPHLNMTAGQTISQALPETRPTQQPECSRQQSVVSSQTPVDTTLEEGATVLENQVAVLQPIGDDDEESVMMDDSSL